MTVRRIRSPQLWTTDRKTGSSGLHSGKIELIASVHRSEHCDRIRLASASWTQRLSELLLNVREVQ